MFIFENEGFLEVETKEITQLSRSTFSVAFGDADDDKYDLQAFLCAYRSNSESRCRVAFYARALKRALIFTVSESGEKSPWRHGKEFLSELGFQLEDVNLKLSPAMQEVVLRDVHGLATPAQARKQRAENLQQSADLQKIRDEDPESPQGKRAALKLGSEKRMNNRAEKLRLLLEELFSPQENVNDELDALLTQVKDLTARLETAESLAETERSQREMSESITTAAEKRIQELEELLVDVETKSSGELKLKRKIVQMQDRINKLDDELKAAHEDVKTEQEKQGQFVDDVKVAHEQVASLQGQLKDTESALDTIQVELEEEQAQNIRLTEQREEDALSIATLTKNLQRAEKTSDQLGDTVDSLKSVESQLSDAQEALDNALQQNLQQEDKLAAAISERDELLKKLEEAVSEANQAADRQQASIELAAQLETLVEEREALSKEYEQVCKVRNRLEKESRKDDRRITKLEKELAAMAESLSVKEEVGQGADESADKLKTLQAELTAEKQRLEETLTISEELESDLRDAHKLIDSLEQMIREIESPAGGKTKSEAPDVLKDAEVVALKEKLQALQSQLDQEVIEKKRLAKAVVVAEKLASEREAELAIKQTEAVKPAPEVLEVEKSTSKPAKLLPHELRPAPKKGAFFRPDWDLEGLPCKSSDQVLNVWETVFNVQISLEGYPSQYCTAFLVVLRLGKKKQVYTLYRLKKNKHTLVCVPKKSPNDDKSLKKAIDEGLKFLRLSGFEMEPLSKEHIDGALGSYFLEAN
jgi:chromosome segregation ATPase